VLASRHRSSPASLADSYAVILTTRTAAKPIASAMATANAPRIKMTALFLQLLMLFQLLDLLMFR